MKLAVKKYNTHPTAKEETLKKKEAKIGAADLHLGDRNHLLRTCEECREGVIVALDGDETYVELIIDGDAVAGGGIFRTQQFENLLQLGSDQVLYAAWKIARWIDGIQAKCLKAKVATKLIKGHHDQANKDNLCVQLAVILRLMGYNVQYVGPQYVGDFWGKKFLAIHGFGRSSYYPISYEAVRDTWKNVTSLMIEGSGPIVRVIFGHTHWFNTGLEIAPGLAADTVGGFNRADVLRYGYSHRPTGMIVYHEGKVTEVRPSEVVYEEERKQEQALFFNNLADIAETLAKVWGWAREEGFVA